MLEFFEELKGETGGFQAGASTNLFGAPKLSKLELLIRETIQNSTDAGCGFEPVKFKFNLKSNLSVNERETLSEKIFLNEPHGFGLRKALRNKKRELPCLILGKPFTMAL